MASKRIGRDARAFASGLACSLLLAASVAIWSGTAGAAPGPAKPVSQGHPQSAFLPANPRQHVSSIRRAAQFFLVDHRAETQAAWRHADQWRHLPPASFFTAPGGALSFNSDDSAMTQNETSIAVDPTSSGGAAAGTIAVGGFNDFRGLFLPSTNTLSGFAVSQTVTCDTGSGPTTCAHLLTDGWVPGVLDPLCTDGSVLTAYGDPVVAANASGTFFYATLATPMVSNTCAWQSFPDGGVILAVSTPTLRTGGCTSALTSSTCWTSFLIDETTFHSCPTSGPNCATDDKEWMAVDPVSGQITLAWDRLDDGNQTPGEFVYWKTCTLQAGPSLSCTAAAQAPCATTCNNTFAPYLAIWHNPTSGVNNVVLTYEQFNTLFPCPPFNGDCETAELHLANLTAGTDQVFTTLGPAAPIDSLAADQYRITSQTKVAADSRSVPSPYIYVTYEQCAPAGTDGRGADYYYNFFLETNLQGQGNCARPQVVVDRFSSTSDTPTAMTVPSGYDQTMPTLAVDQAGAAAGTVTLAYNSTNDDPQHAALREYVTQAAAGSTAFGAPYTSLMGNQQYTADPGVTIGDAPEFGDYLQVATLNGAIFLHFTGTYEMKAGPALLGTVLVNQDDNYLCYFVPGASGGLGAGCQSS